MRRLERKKCVLWRILRTDSLRAVRIDWKRETPRTGFCSILAGCDGERSRSRSTSGATQAFEHHDHCIGRFAPVAGNNGVLAGARHPLRQTFGRSAPGHRRIAYGIAGRAPVLEQRRDRPAGIPAHAQGALPHPLPQCRLGIAGTAEQAQYLRRASRLAVASGRESAV
jgi:hypothetical protein